MPRPLALALAALLTVPGGPRAAPADPLAQPALPSAIAERSPLFALAQAGARLVAVGQRGHILWSDDAGAHWRQAQVPVSTDLTAVHFASAQHGWAVGHDGVVLHSADGGQTWTRQLDGRRAAEAIVERYGAPGAASNAEARAVLTEARRMLTDGPDLPFLDVWFEDERRGYVVGAFNLVFSTSDGGATWQPASDRTDNPRSYHLYAIHGRAGEVVVAGELGLLLRLDRATGRFSALPSPYKGTFFGVLATPNLLLAYGLRGNAWRSTDGGKTWQQAHTGVQTSLTGATALSDGRILLVGSGGELLASRDGGLHFAPQAGVTPQPAFAVAPAGVGRIARVGARGVQIETLPPR